MRLGGRSACDWVAGYHANRWPTGMRFRIGEKGKSAIPLLVDLLDDPDDGTRWRSVAAIGHIGSSDEDVKKAVYATYGDLHARVRFNTIFAISKLRDDNSGGLKVYHQALHDPDPQNVNKALGHLGGLLERERARAEDSLPLLQERLLGMVNLKDAEIRKKVLGLLPLVFKRQELLKRLPDYHERLSADNLPSGYVFYGCDSSGLPQREGPGNEFEGKVSLNRLSDADNAASGREYWSHVNRHLFSGVSDN